MKKETTENYMNRHKKILQDNEKTLLNLNCIIKEIMDEGNVDVK